MLGETEVRINYNLDREKAAQLDSLLPAGTRTQLLRRITEMVVTFLVENPAAIGFLLNGHVELRLTRTAMEEIKRIGETS